MGDKVEENQRDVITEAWSEKCSAAGPEDERGSREPRNTGTVSRSWNRKGDAFPLECWERGAALLTP